MWNCSCVHGQELSPVFRANGSSGGYRGAGTGTWGGQIVLLRGGGAVLGRGVGIRQETKVDSHCEALVKVGQMANTTVFKFI